MTVKEMGAVKRSKTVTKDKQTGPVSALIGMLTRPKATLGSLAQGERTWWWVPAVLMVLAMVATTVTYASAYAQVMYEQQLAYYEQVPEQDRGPMPEPELRMTPAITLVIRGGGQFFGTAVTWLAWSGALTLAAGLLGAPALSFGRAFAWFAWANLPVVVRGVVQSGYMMLTKNPIYNKGLSGLVVDQTPAPIVLGPQRRMPTIPTQGQVILASVLGQVDLFVLWHLALLVTGLVICAHWRRGRAIFTVAGIALLMVAAGSVFAVLGGAFGRLRLF